MQLWRGHLSVRNLYIFLILIVISCLIGCQGTGGYADASGVTAELERTPTVISTQTNKTPTLNVTVEPTATPTLMPTQTPSPTPTPFICPQRRGKVFQDTLVSKAMQTEEIRYAVYVPPCYSHYRGYSFPVLYLLHGWPMDETHWTKLGIVDIVDAWITQGLIGPLIMVMPGVSNPHGMYINSSGGDYSFEGMIVNELVPLVDKKYSTWQDPEARAIGGISRGGVWALEIGFRHPDLFGRVGAHSPALSVNYPLPAYDPFRLVESVDPAQRIYLSAGDKDWARASTISLRDLLQENDLNVTYQVHEGAHIDDLWRLGLPEYLHFYVRDWPRSVEDLPTRTRRVPVPEPGQGFD